MEKAVCGSPCKEADYCQLHVGEASKTPGEKT